MLDPRIQVQDKECALYARDCKESWREMFGLFWVGISSMLRQLSYDGAGNWGAFHSYYSRGFIEQDFSAWCLASSKRSGPGLFLGGGLTSEAAVLSTETSNLEIKHHTRRAGELRLITPVGPEVLTLQALRPKQRGYRVLMYRWQWATLAAICWFKLRCFLRVGTVVKTGRGCLTFTRAGMIKQACRGRAIAKSRTRVSETSSSS